MNASVRRGALAVAQVEYLRSPGPETAGRLMSALRDQGRLLDAFLLMRFAESGPQAFALGAEGGGLAGRPVFLDVRPPVHAPTGSLWWDPVEVVAAILVSAIPEPPEVVLSPEEAARRSVHEAWLSLEPVAVWQFRAFLELVGPPTRRYDAWGKESPVAFFDPERIGGEDETAAVAGMFEQEANVYSEWLGKTTACEVDWHAASRTLPTKLYGQLWSGAELEWAGEVNSGSHLALSGQTSLLAPEDRRVQFPDHEQYGDCESMARIGFRSSVWIRSGGVTFGGLDVGEPDDGVVRVNRGMAWWNRESSGL